MVFNRIVRAIQLDPQVYLEMSSDKRALGLALGIVFLSSLATGVGSAGGSPEKIPYLTGMALAGWLVWIAMTYVIGAKMFPTSETPCDMGAVLRVAALASAPGLLRFLAYLPPFTVIASTGAVLWMFGTTVIAMQQAFRYRTLQRAVAVTLLGYLIFQWIYYKA